MHSRKHAQKTHKTHMPEACTCKPAQTIDADMKRELRLLRLRGAYDTKRFYKSFDSTK